MYDVLHNYLITATYTLADGQNRIDYAVARGRITPEQAQTLADIVAERGTPEALTPKSLDERMTDAEAAIAELAEMISMMVMGDEALTDATSPADMPPEGLYPDDPEQEV